MTATGISASLGLSQADSRARHIRFWLAVFGLALADAASFAVIHFLLRAGQMVPRILMVSSGIMERTPIDVFEVLAAAFVVVRYLAGDYGRRQLFWDGAKVTTIALIVTALPDLAMLALGRGLYSAPRVIGSWLLLIFLVPVMRQGARVLMSRLDVWQISTVMIGAGPRAEEILDALRHSLSLGFDVRWLVLESPDCKPPASMTSLRTVHSADVARTAHVMRNAGCKQAIVAAEDIQSAHFAEIAQRLLEVNIPVAIVPALTRLHQLFLRTRYSDAAGPQQCAAPALANCEAAFRHCLLGLASDFVPAIFCRTGDHHQAGQPRTSVLQPDPCRPPWQPLQMHQAPYHGVERR